MGTTTSLPIKTCSDLRAESTKSTKSNINKEPNKEPITRKSKIRKESFNERAIIKEPISKRSVNKEMINKELGQQRARSTKSQVNKEP